MLFIDSGFIYKNYWFETGTPTFLISLLKKGDYFIPRLENLTADAKLIDSFDIENLALEAILFQSGYLTIKSVEENPFGALNYHLKIPNKEVAISLNDVIIEYLVNNRNPLHVKTELFLALENAEIESLKTTLIALFSSIPYNNYVNNTIAHFEGYYASVLYAYFASLGIEIIAEDVTHQGRIDLTFKLSKHIYILEFKVGTQNALQQIKSRDYHQKYLADLRDIYLIGINFDEKKKNISQFEWEKIN